MFELRSKSLKLLKRLLSVIGSDMLVCCSSDWFLSFSSIPIPKRGELSLKMYLYHKSFIFDFSRAETSYIDKSNEPTLLSASVFAFRSNGKLWRSCLFNLKWPGSGKCTTYALLIFFPTLRCFFISLIPNGSLEVFYASAPLGSSPTDFDRTGMKSMQSRFHISLTFF